MKTMRILVLSVVSLIVLQSIAIACKESTKNQQILYSDEIHMQYNADGFYIPILDAILNDSLPFKVFFDTGVPSKYVIVSDSLEDKLIGDSILVQIGQQKMYMRTDFIDSKSKKILNALGPNAIIVGWEFFDDKIIEFSFDKQRIYVYQSLPDVTKYSKTKITISLSSHLRVPIEIMLQGKAIKDSAFIDTGNTAHASFGNELISKYGLDTTKAFNGLTETNIGSLAVSYLSVDTIRIGDTYLSNENIMVGFRPRPKTRQVAGLLGIKTLAKFSVILDLINYDLYLKPINAVPKTNISTLP